MSFGMMSAVKKEEQKEQMATDRLPLAFDTTKKRERVQKNSS